MHWKNWILGNLAQKLDRVCCLSSYFSLVLLKMMWSPGHSRCRCMNGCFCVEPSINPVDLSWLGQCIDGRSNRLLNLEIKKIEIALSSATWSVTWHSVFGEGDVCWVPDQWKERTVTPGYVFVSNSSVTVGLDSVFKSYIKRRLYCDERGRRVLYSSARMHVCIFWRFGVSKYTVILS